MPSRLKRYYTARDLHSITCSCYRRRALLDTARRRDLFLKLLEQTRQRYRLVVVGYAVMPEHFHRLISEPEKGDPSVVMKVLKQRFARRVHRKKSTAQLIRDIVLCRTPRLLETPTRETPADLCAPCGGLTNFGTA